MKTKEQILKIIQLVEPPEHEDLEEADIDFDQMRLVSDWLRYVVDEDLKYMTKEKVDNFLEVSKSIRKVLECLDKI